MRFGHKFRNCGSTGPLCARAEAQDFHRLNAALKGRSSTESQPLAQPSAQARVPPPQSAQQQRGPGTPVPVPQKPEDPRAQPRVPPPQRAQNRRALGTPAAAVHNQVWRLLRLTRTSRQIIAATLIYALVFSNATGQSSQQQPQPTTRGQGLYRLRVESELVLVNVVVRDKQGNPVTGLTRDDFTLLEDGKAQRVSSFDF